MKKYRRLTIKEWLKEAAMAVLICVTGAALIWICAAADAAFRS
jgi:hypothetical protein